MDKKENIQQGQGVKVEKITAKKREEEERVGGERTTQKDKETETKQRQNRNQHNAGEH